MASTSSKLPSLRSTVVGLWRSLTKDLFDPYRPELYYMRGPGPKWREKHTQTPRDRRARLGHGSLRTI